MPRSHDSLETATVFVVDPDPSAGQVVCELLDGSAITSVLFQTGREFLSAHDDGQPGCLVLEQRMPDMSGLQLQRRLAAAGCTLPLIFVTSKPDVSTAVELMRGGAVHVLEKPVRAVELLEAIHEALALDRDRREARDQSAKVKNLTETLTRKERQVLELVAAGKSPKAIAAELDLSVRAVELRRSSLMEKIDLCSSMELMRFAIVAHQESRLGRDSHSPQSNRMLASAF